MYTEKKKILTCAKTLVFACTADKCPDNCCRFWRIHIYEHEYAKLSEKFDDTDIGKKLRDCITADEANSTEQNPVYAFKINPKGDCIFLESSGLCELHRKLGADYLPRTCVDFPRGVNIYGGFYQSYLSLRCPVAAELILFDKNGVDFCLNGDIEIDKYAAAPPDTPSVLGEGLCLLIRDVCIDILKSQKSTLDVKLTYIADMLAEIDKITDEPNNKAKIRDISDKYKKNAQDPGLPLKTPNTATYGTADLSGYYYKITEFFHKTLFLSKIPYSSSNTSFYKALKKISYRFKDFDGYNKRLQGKRTELNPLFTEYEYVFCNYIIYNMFTNRFPYEFPRVPGSFFGLIISVVMLRLLIICLYDINGNIPEKPEIISAISFLSGKTIHSRQYLPMLKEFYEDNESIDTALLAVLAVY